MAPFNTKLKPTNNRGSPEGLKVLAIAIQKAISPFAATDVTESNDNRPHSRFVTLLPLN